MNISFILHSIYSFYELLERLILAKHGDINHILICYILAEIERNASEKLFFH